MCRGSPPRRVVPLTYIQAGFSQWLLKPLQAALLLKDIISFRAGSMMSKQVYGLSGPSSQVSELRGNSVITLWNVMRNKKADEEVAVSDLFYVLWLLKLGTKCLYDFVTQMYQLVLMKLGTNKYSQRKATTYIFLLNWKPIQREREKRVI